MRATTIKTLFLTVTFLLLTQITEAKSPRAPSGDTVIIEDVLTGLPDLDRQICESYYKNQLNDQIIRHAKQIQELQKKNWDQAKEIIKLKGQLKAKGVKQ